MKCPRGREVLQRECISPNILQSKINPHTKNKIQIARPPARVKRPLKEKMGRGSSPHKAYVQVKALQLRE
jgi:hypothetical protein